MKTREMASISVILSIVSIGALAAVFPSSSGDLALVANWGGDLPGTDENIVISNGTYTVSSDVCFGGLERVYNTRNGVNTMMIDQTGQEGVKVQLNGFRPSVSVSAPANTNWFKGGWFDFRGNSIQFDKNFSGAWANADNQCISFTDGAVATNVSKMMLYGSGSVGEKLWVDGSSLYVDKASPIFGYGQGGDGEILVSNGGLFHAKDRLILTDGVASSSRKDTAFFTTNRLVVSGQGSRFIGLGGPAVSTGGNGDHILVTDGGYFSGKVYFGVGNLWNTNNFMRVEKNARADLPDVRLCSSAVNGLAGGRFEIMDGAVVSNDSFYVGAYASTSFPEGAAGCSLLVSNATFSVKYLSIGQGTGGSNNTVVISGRNAVFDHVPVSASQYTYFGGGRHCRFQVENGAEVEWRHQDGWSYNTTVSNCMVCVTGGGTLRRNGGFHTASDRDLLSGGNVLEVTDGGILDVSKILSVSGTGSSLIVSNGTVTAKEINVGAELPLGSSAGDGLLLVAGSSAKISATNGAFRVMNSSTLRYDLSDGGYASSSHVPVEVNGAAEIEEGCTLEIDGADAARVRNINSLTLLRADSISVPDSILEAVAVRAGGMCRLKTVESDGKALLTLRFIRGLSISIR